MYDSDHKRLARLYMLVLLAFFFVLGALVYISPAQSTSELEARLSGSFDVRTEYPSEYIAAIAKSAVVRVNSDLSGTLSFPSVEVKEQNGRLLVSIGDEETLEDLEIGGYARDGSGAYVGDGYIATNAHVVSLDATISEIYMGLVDDEMYSYLENALSTESPERVGELEDAYYGGEYDEDILAAHDVFVAKVVADVTNTVTVTHSDGSDVEAEIVASYAPRTINEKDIALLSVPLGNTPALLLDENQSPQAVGSAVYVTGYPYGAEISEESENEATFSQGVLNAYKELTDEVFVYQTDVRASTQSSGSPLLNSQGEVVGLLSLTSNEDSFFGYGIGDTFSFAMPSRYINELAQEAGISLNLSESAEELYGGFAHLTRSDCKSAQESFASVSYGDYTQFTSECADALASTDGFLAQISSRIAATDRLVLIAIGTLAVLLFILFLLLVFLRSRLLRDESKTDSLGRFVSQMHSR